jgi:hypothetical protein
MLQYRPIAGVTQSVYWLGHGQNDWGSVPGRGNDGIFSFRHWVQTDSGAHPTHNKIIIWGFYPRVKAAGAWNWLLTSIQCRGYEWVDLYLHSANKPSWHGT